MVGRLAANLRAIRPQLSMIQEKAVKYFHGPGFCVRTENRGSVSNVRPPRGGLSTTRDDPLDPSGSAAGSSSRPFERCGIPSVRMFSAAAVIVMALLPAQAVQSNQVLPGEFMFPAAPKDVWKQTRQLIEELGFRSEKADDRHQILVTRWRSYSGESLPERSALGLGLLDTPTRIQLHLAVAPELEPARVAVEVILELKRATADRSIRTIRAYRHDALGAWLLSKLASRIGSGPIALADSFDARVRQAAALIAGTATDACSKNVASLQTSAITSPTGVTPPRKLSDVQPIYPGDVSTGTTETVITVQGEITEHGTLVKLRPTDISPSMQKFAGSAVAAAGLWRFEPARIGACRVPVLMTLRVNYALR